MIGTKVKGYIIKIIIGLVSLLAAQVLFAFIMYASTFIPQEAIRSNMEKSADLLCGKDMFFEVIEGIVPTKIDRYADSITLNIAWNLGGEDHLENSLLCEFLSSDLINENINFRSSVTGEISEYQYTQQYLRYWHGSSSLMRFMHLFMSLKEIYITNGAIILALAGINILVFIRKKKYCCAVAFSAGLVATSSFFVPLSLEYTWVYIVMLTVTLLVSLMLYGNDNKRSIDQRLSTGVYIIFIGAMVVNFLDFLTAETLTLTVPLLIVMRNMKKEKTGNNISNGYDGEIFTTVFCIISWGIGYIGTWVSKWLISSIVLEESVLPYITGHITERLGGEIYGDTVSQAGQVFGAIGRNIINLFPVGYGAPGIVGTLIIVIVLTYITFVYRKKDFDRKRIILYALIGLIPYIRYLVLHNHSYIHRFFTCRAQMATVMAVILIIAEITDIKKSGKTIKKSGQKSR